MQHFFFAAMTISALETPHKNPYKFQSSQYNNQMAFHCLGSQAFSPKTYDTVPSPQKKEIHIYKNIFMGSYSEIIDSIVTASYFYLIKKLKKNDFHFEKSTV